MSRIIKTETSSDEEEDDSDEQTEAEGPPPLPAAAESRLLADLETETAPKAKSGDRFDPVSVL